MNFDKIHNKGQARIFKNRYLEYLTKTHPLLIWGLYLPAIVLLPYYGFHTLEFTGWQITLFFLLGMFVWTLFEYLMHRYVFHFVSENPSMQQITYVLHGNHHEYPRDRQRLFMPPVPSLILSSIIFLTQYALMGNYVMIFFPGFILGYLVYGSMHYAIHAWNPPYKWMKPVWRNHHLHHYKSEEKGFGVSTHIWDWVFGTGFDLNKEKEDKEQVKKLMYGKVKKISPKQQV